MDCPTRRTGGALPARAPTLALTSRPLALALSLLLLLAQAARPGRAISIKPSEFERLIMPCYVGGSGGGGFGGFGSAGQPYGAPGQPSAYSAPGAGAPQQAGRLGAQGPSANYQSPAYYAAAGSGAYPGRAGSAGEQQAPGAGAGAYLGSSAPGAPQQFSAGGPAARDSLAGAGLGQAVPRANTMENFIALVSKIEVANPRLANNPDALIRALLARFRLDNYYYDARSRTPISEPDRRAADILPALMGAGGGGGGASAGAFGSANYGAPLGELLPEQALEPDERCSMYFMLSHFIDKTSPATSPALGQMPLSQLAGPLAGQRPPSLQAAGAGYPGASANYAYSGGGGIGGVVGGGVGGASQTQARYPGPSPSFGSPQTANMNAFGAGIGSTNAELASQRNPFGVNSPAQPAAGSSSLYAPVNSALANAQLRNPNVPFPGLPGRPPYIDASGGGSIGGGGGAARGALRDPERLAFEYGVVTTAGQDNAALVLNRVLLGMLAATTPAQSIRQLASLIYPTQTINANTPRMDEELDPLFAVTLADLWAVSAIPRAGKPLDFRLLGDNGRWNDAMCPTSFALERSSSIRFTTAELLGGLDGFALGQFRRRLLSMRRNIRLSELLRIYYSRTGFRPQFPEVGVCQRAASLSTQLDELHRQAENYLRLYQLSLPTSDNQIALQIGQLDGFRELTRAAAANYAPQDICMDSPNGGGGGGGGGLSSMDLYPVNGQDACELSRADVVLVLDVSAQANQPFEQLLAAKLAQRIGLSRGTNSLTILTNQQDSSGYAGAYSFNTIVRNSTNLGEIGCALTHDTSQSYQGGQVTDPTRLMEMFERALVNLDSEYLTRQLAGATSYSRNQQQQQSSSSSYSSSYVSTWFGMGGGGGGGAAESIAYSPYGAAQGGPRNTGGAKIILWFNYGPQARPAQAASGPTNWNSAQGSSAASFPFSSYNADSQEYKFYEAKKYLRENFRGAAILALAAGRDDVKPFVYDEDRDIFTDIASGGAGGSGNSAGVDSFSSAGSLAPLDAASQAMLGGQADQLINKLLARMCSVPALFQYPMCFREPSNNAASAGYISPGRRQYWMMAPKTFFASRFVRLVFRVEGGRLRVCFGRMPNPDETAARYNQANGIYDQQRPPAQAAISFASQPTYQTGTGSGSGMSMGMGMGASGGGGGGGGSYQQSTTPAPTASSGDYYTGRDHGECKDVAPGQEIDFLISDPCYKKSIAECEPFYFVLREISQPGEGDPNYMCRDDGCKRFDQAKFVMTHTGVACSSAPRAVRANWLLIMISTLAASILSLSSLSAHGPAVAHPTPVLSKRSLGPRLGLAAMPLGLVALYLMAAQQVARAQQQAGVYDFGQNRYGEKRGNFTPAEVTAIILILMLILGGLALTISLCYYVAKRARAGLQPVAQSDY